MADQSVFFDKSNSQATLDPTANPQEALTNQLKSIVNEDGNQKYDSLPKALEGLANSQTYIPQLKNELAGVQAELSAAREKLAKNEAVEDVVARLTQNQQTQQPDTTTQTVGLDENAVVDLFNKLQTEGVLEATEASNERQVSNALVATFGDKAKEALASKASELNTTVDALKEQARKNPGLVLAAFKTQPTPVKLTQGSQHITSLDAPPAAPLTRPEKSVLSGATSKEQTEFMRKVRDEVYAEYGIQG